MHHSPVIVEQVERDKMLRKQELPGLSFEGNILSSQVLCEIWCSREAGHSTIVCELNMQMLVVTLICCNTFLACTVGWPVTPACCFGQEGI